MRIILCQGQSKVVTNHGRSTVLLGLAVVTGLLLSRALWLPAIGAFLIYADPLVPAELVMPLAGDLERVTYAARLYQAGYARGLLLTNLPLATQAQRKAHLEHARALALSQGVAPNDIFVVPQFAWTTYGEARRIRETLERLPVQSLLVVTSPWHTRRSRLVFDAVFHDSRARVNILPIQGKSRRSLPGYVKSWWRERSTVSATASEYLKLIAFSIGIR